MLTGWELSAVWPFFYAVGKGMSEGGRESSEYKTHEESGAETARCFFSMNLGHFFLPVIEVSQVLLWYSVEELGTCGSVRHSLPQLIGFQE